MQLNRTRALTAFAGYVRGYDARQPKVCLKITHTYRVAALCEMLAKSIRLAPQQVDLAWLCGLLHDVGRFEQLRRFGTFNDAKSIDHALCSDAVLFEQGHIADYLTPGAASERELAMLRTAVRTHSAYRLPPELDAETLQFCNLLRDADKIDILRVNCETPMTEIYNVSAEQLYGLPVTPEVLACFYQHQAVPRALKRTPVDNVVGHISLTYELVYPESLREVYRQGWLAKMMAFSSRDAGTRAAFAALRFHMEQWLLQQTGGAARPEAEHEPKCGPQQRGAATCVCP